VGVVTLRRLVDAVRDGERILAVVKGSAINNDGAVKAGFTAPAMRGQADVIGEALANAGVMADDISYCSRPPDLSNFGHWFDNKPSFLALF